MKYSWLMMFGVLAIGTFLILPYASWINIEVDEDAEEILVDDTITVSVHVEATCMFYRDWDSVFSIDITQSQPIPLPPTEKPEKPSYWEYLVDYWTGGGTQSVVPPTEYPFSQVLIEVNHDETTRVVDYQPYTYGTTFTMDWDYIAEIGDSVTVQVQIYWAQSSGDYASELYSVTGR